MFKCGQNRTNNYLFKLAFLIWRISELQISICHCFYMISPWLNWICTLPERLNAKFTGVLEKWKEIYSTFWCLLVENRRTINWIFRYYPETLLSNGSDMKESLFKEIEIFLYSTIQDGSFIVLIQKQETEKDWLAVRYS